MPTVDTVIEDARWQDAGLDGLAQRAADATLGHLGLVPATFEIVVMGCDDARIAALNADFRGKPRPTNVLSWPAAERGAGRDGAAPALPLAEEDAELGDIAIAYGVCEAEAHAQNKPFDAHVIHLLVHGILHLLGYDHIRDADAALMERQEVAILASLGVADPYRDDGV